jgi:alkylresorcinol/alkylpyrone synthase
MPKIFSIGTALPPFVATQEDAKTFAQNLYGEVYKGNIDRLVGIFENTLIQKRHFCVPVEWFGSPKTFEEKNRLYIENAVSLSESSIQDCLDKAQLAHQDIDYLVFVSTTGLSTPSIDARLIDRLPFRKSIRRLPIWGLGCAGGAGALSWANTLARADKTAKVLIVVTELCGLTFVRSDMSKAALISSALFADGSASVLVCGDEVKANSGQSLPQILSSETATLARWLDVMGWRFNEDGFNVLLSQDVPDIVMTFLKPLVCNFLKKNELDFKKVQQFILHPGGAKVLEAYEKAFDLSKTQLSEAVDVLTNFGNMSAVTILFILERFMKKLGDTTATDLGLAAALGPGFSAELVLLKWAS